MQSFTRQIFHGTPSPSEKIISQAPEYHVLLDKIHQTQTYLAGKLPAEDVPQLMALGELYDDSSALDVYAGFAYGLRLGMGLVWEAVHP